MEKWAEAYLLPRAIWPDQALAVAFGAVRVCVCVREIVQMGAGPRLLHT